MTEKPARSDIGIVSFDPQFAEAFAELNYQWIEQYFSVEAHDRETLDDPAQEVIGKGGEIFFAVTDGRAVGTVALLKEAQGSFELAKMAVAPEYRGQGIGDLLIEACVDYCRENQAPSICLLSNRKLGPALALYRKHGFVEVPVLGDEPYERVDIRMELAITAPEG